VGFEPTMEMLSRQIKSLLHSATLLRTENCDAGGIQTHGGDVISTD